ncbi:MAG: outer membrane lipoprotein carrier protein LolA [Candidatus Aphodousia sp.]|nr:outer membrane lipoprotein carrier protein LolA [Sutterella sp.]MDY2899784.1 outer membrane lipoprotein carrier protein LolA [Candidatus Aphodousia sp.]
MHLIFTLFTAVLLSLSTESVAADYGVIRARIDDAAVFEGRFVQSERLVNAPKLFECHGYFIFKPDDVLFWRTQTPVPTTSIYNDREFKTFIYINDARIENTSTPTTNIINRILWSLLSEGNSSLELDFNVHTQTDGNQWQMDLYPITTAMLSVVKRVTVTGDTFVRQIKVESFSNDFTTVRLSDIERFPVLSTRQERDLANP